MSEIIAKVGQPKGSNQFSVQIPLKSLNYNNDSNDNNDDDAQLVEVLVQLGRSMTSNRKSKVWVKRGSYCLIEKFDNSNKTKVFGELYKLLSQNDEKDLKKLNKWPKAFMQSQSNNNNNNNDNDNEENDDDLFVNTNRRVVVEQSESENDDSDA